MPPTQTEGSVGLQNLEKSLAHALEGPEKAEEQSNSSVSFCNAAFNDSDDAGEGELSVIDRQVKSSSQSVNAGNFGQHGSIKDDKQLFEMSELKSQS